MQNKAVWDHIEIGQLLVHVEKKVSFVLLNIRLYFTRLDLTISNIIVHSEI